MSLSEFDKKMTELVTDTVVVPEKIELPQYQVDEYEMKLEYMVKGTDKNFYVRRL